MLVFSRTVMPRCGWVVVLDHCNILTSQEDDTFFHEVAQEVRQVGPPFHHRGEGANAVTREFRCGAQSYRFSVS